MGALKVSIDLVPIPLWRLNLRSLLRGWAWQKLRREIIAARGLNCEICGKHVPQRINAHEMWNYSESTNPAVAVLEGVRLCCWHCHHCEHWGNLERLSRQLPRAMQDTINHFCVVNGVGPDELERQKKEAYAVWRRRSYLHWTIDWGEFGGLLLDRYDELPQPRRYTREQVMASAAGCIIV